MAEGKFGPERGFGEGLFTDGGEGVRALVEEVVQALIEAEADEHFGAPWNAKGLMFLQNAMTEWFDFTKSHSLEGTSQL